MPWIPVLEIGGTHVTAALMSADARAVHRDRRWPLDGGATAQVLVAALVEAANWLAADAGSSWGVAMPGPFDYSTGVAKFEGVGKFEGLFGVDLKTALMAGLVNRPSGMTFINDASAFLLGEWLVGAGAGTDTCVGITLGTGIGSAFLRNGLLVENGEDVPPDAEVHLLRHRGLPLEDWVSRRALMAQYRGGTGTTIDVREIAARARAGDVLAARAFTTAFAALGEVLGPWLTKFGAEVLVVGGSISGAWDLIAAPLAKGLAISAPEAVVRRASGGERAPLIGAALAAR